MHFHHSHSQLYILRPCSAKTQPWNSPLSHLGGGGGSQLCHTCEFLYWNAFWALCAAELKSNKKLSVHLFEVASWITQASLHRLCVLLWALGSSNTIVIFLVLAAEMRLMLLVSIRPCTMLFLPGCSSLSLTSPLNYCVCAHGSVTLNPGFILLSDRRHRRHVCRCDIWQAATLSARKCNYSNEIKEEMGVLIFSRHPQTSTLQFM